MRTIALLLLILPIAACGGLTLIDYNREGAPECFDELPDCAQRVLAGDCKGKDEDSLGDIFIKIVRITLLSCRASCRASILKEYNEGKLSEMNKGMINLSGGIGNIVEDMFGNFHEICNLEMGFDIRARNVFLDNLIMSKMAFRNVPGLSHAKRYTKEGIKKSKLPKGLFGDILDYRQVRPRIKDWQRESCNPGVHYPCMLPFTGEENTDECVYRNETGMEMMTLSDDLVKALYNVLRPEGEKWAGVPLVNSNVYGIRRYKRRAQLFTHVDHIDTHVISAIINVAQKVDKPWPLEIVDFDQKVHKVLLKPREVLWYESTKLPHGRPTPFEGEYFDNIFVHFRPKTKEDEQKEQDWLSSNSPDSDNKLHITF